jgi:hypothetical protein
MGGETASLPRLAVGGNHALLLDPAYTTSRLGGLGSA